MLAGRSYAMGSDGGSTAAAHPDGSQLVVAGDDHGVDIDTPTLISVSALAWVAANVFHEIVGHAGAAVLLGIPIRAISTTTASLEWDAIESITQDRIINAAATPVNVVTGAIAVAALRWLPTKNVALHYFLWLFAAVSFTMATWNMVTLGILGAGDWGEVATGLERAGIWTGGVIAVGAVVAILGFVLPLRLFLPDLRDHPRLRHKIVFVSVATDRSGSNDSRLRLRRGGASAPVAQPCSGRCLPPEPRLALGYAEPAFRRGSSG